VDKKKEIGSPVRCAEGLGYPSFALLGLDTKSEFVQNKVNRAVMFSPSGRKLDINVPYQEFSLYILDRSRFEKDLANTVRKKKGDILLNTAALDLVKKDKKVVGLKTSQGEISSKIIIGADGVESRIGRLCGLSKRLKLNEIFTCVQHTLVDLEGVDDHFEIHFGSKYAPGGYAWMFPKGNGMANFGLGVLASTKKRPLKLLEKFKSDHANSASSIRFVGGCIPSTCPLPKTVSDNIMLVGDAARQTNAVSGGGIANAILAGRMAGEIAGRVVTNNKPIKELMDYDRLWRIALEKVLKKKLKQRRYLEDDRTCERMFSFLKLAATLKPIIPKRLIVKWLTPNF
jgi:digeranylgeranylglycerophospholipid reductase